MKIDVIASPGSSDGVTPRDVESPGVGGSELALMQWAETMSRRGHQISIYNDPSAPGMHGGVEFLPRSDFESKTFRDVLISFRGPEEQYVKGASARVRIGWSTDRLEKDRLDVWIRLVDGMVGISEYQKKDHILRCGLDEAKMRVIDLGVDIGERGADIQKKPFQCMYTSVPNRGLVHLAGLWPQIVNLFPAAKLIITSDYRLWNHGVSADNDAYRSLFQGMEGVEFLGCIPRSQLIKIERESEIHLYSCVFEELFCISSAEAQVAGCYGITSNAGALPSTNATGYCSPYHPASGEFRADALREIRQFYQIDWLERRQLHHKISTISAGRFDWGRICDEWEQYIQYILSTK